MKKVSLLFFATFFMLGIFNGLAQEEPIKKSTVVAAEDEDGPIMFKFEPNYVSQNEERKEVIAKTRKIIDTLQISERKRLKLIKDLYKNGLSKRLQKALLVDVKMPEVEE